MHTSVVYYVYNLTKQTQTEMNEMTKRQSLINKVAKRLALTNEDNQDIKVVEITTDEDDGYVTNATRNQWYRFSNEVIKLANGIRDERNFNEEILAMMTAEEIAAIEEELGI